MEVAERSHEHTCWAGIVDGAKLFTELKLYLIVSRSQYFPLILTHSSPAWNGGGVL